MSDEESDSKELEQRINSLRLEFRNLGIRMASLEHEAERMKARYQENKRRFDAKVKKPSKEKKE
jgi:hypothetical protein